MIFNTLKMGHKTLIPSKVFERAIIERKGTIEDMDREIEQKDQAINFLEKWLLKKLPVLDSKFIEKVNRLGLNKKSSKVKGVRIMERLTNSPNNDKYIRKRKQ